MNNKNIIFKKSIEQYQKKYRNHKERLLKYSKEDVEKFDKLYGSYEFNGKEYKLKDQHYLLKNRKWMLIDNTYYEIPKAPRWTWFRNLQASTQVITSVLVSGAVSCGVVFPTLFATIWKPISVNVNKEVAKYIDIKPKEKIEVGKPYTTELDIKAESKDDVQLPESYKNIEVYTGGVKLDYYDPTTYTTSNSINLNTPRNNTVEPENYFTYKREARDKASLYIKKILGPVSINLSVEERSYDVTFDLGSGKEKQTVEVKKNKKVTKPSDPERELCDFKKWIEEGKSDEFDFENTLIKKDTVIKAHWEANATGVVIRGINGLDESYSTIQAAYDAGKQRMLYLNSSDLFQGTCSKDKFLEVFSDVVEDETEGLKANITWELYTKNDASLELPYGEDNQPNRFMFSFGRGSNSFGDGDDKLYIENTFVTGVTDTKPTLKLLPNSSNSTFQHLMTSNYHSNKNISNKFTFKNIDFDDALITASVPIIQASGSMDYIMNYESCNLHNKVYVEYGCKEIVTVNNCVFDGPLDNDGKPKFTYALQYENPNQEGDRIDQIRFTNNVVKNYKRAIQIDCSKAGNVLIEGNSFSEINLDKAAGWDNAAVQFSCGTGTSINVLNNNFYHVYSNCFKVHRNFIKGGIITINNNDIKECGYVGATFPGNSSSQYSLTSKGNTIDLQTVETTKAGYGDAEETSDLEHIIKLY